ncbi:MAG: outer membrane beta-barrel protein [Bacteroidia bacterium]|nr:outer membrane beta-barrel protein [Bacteroidia bacterium]
MKKFILSFMLFLPLLNIAQEREKLDKESGYFSLGVRSTASAFSDDGAYGFGYGGQFRIRVLNRVNTDWYMDYITTDISGIARRVDWHIGWSVLTYPFNYEMLSGKVTPYLLAGHCFDYTKVSKNNSDFYLDKFSSAVQAGVGAHYNVNDRMDISLTTQYMMHLGYNVKAEVFEFDNKKDVLIEKQAVRGVEGHLLINMSLNVRLFDMWDQHRKKKQS